MTAKGFINSSAIANLKKRTILFFITALIAIFNSPYTHNPDVDVELFRNIGNGIYNGKILYKELFDHKPPLIHFISALVHPFGIWGNWIIAVIMAFITSTCLVNLSKYYQLKWPYILPIAFLLLIYWQRELFARYADSRFFTVNFAVILIYLFITKPKSHFIIKGILATLILFTQQNEVLIPMVLFLFFHSYIYTKSLFAFLKTFGLLILGFFLVAIPIIFYFYLNNAFTDFYYAVVVFNKTYFWSSISFKEHFVGLKMLLVHSALPKYFIGLFMASFILFIFNKNKIEKKVFYLGFICTAIALFNTVIIGHYLLYYTFNLIIPCLFLLLTIMVFINNYTINFKIKYVVLFLFLLPLVLKPSIVIYALNKVKIQKLNSTAYNNYLKDIYDSIALAPKKEQHLFVFNAAPSYSVANKLNIIPFNKWSLNYFWVNDFYVKSSFDANCTIFINEIMQPLINNKPNFIICNVQHQKDTSDYRTEVNALWRPFLYTNYTLVKIADNNEDIVLYKLNK